MSRRPKPAPPADTFAAPQAETDAVLNAARALGRRAIALGDWLDQAGVSLPWPLAMQLVAVVAEARQLGEAVERFRVRMEMIPDA
jgi:hypothetical protein